MEPVHALLHTLCKSHGQSITACAADAKRADEAERSIREHAECFSAEEHRFAIDARAKMPCGHFEVYAVSPDGKSVFCSLCQLATANAEIERLMARPVDDHPGWESARETMFDAHERQRAAQERS